MAAVREPWRRLVAEVRQPEFFQLHGWHEAYLRCLEDSPDDFVILELGRDGAVTGFLPLRLGPADFLGLRLAVLALPSHNQAPLAGIVLRDSEVLSDYLAAMAIATAAAGVRWDAMRLGRVPAGSPGLDGMGPSGSALPSLRIWRARFNVVPCAQPFESIAAGWSKNFRGNLRKARNKLQAAGTVGYVTTSEHADFETCLSQFLEVEASGWKGGQGRGSAIALDPRRAEFYRSLGSRMEPEGVCEINLLLLDDRCIAGQFCLRCGGTVNVLKIGYSEDHARLAPGNMLMERLLARAAGTPEVQRVSFVSDSDWHRDWRPESTDVFDLWIFNRTARGIVARAFMSSREGAKRAYRHLRRLRGSASSPRGGRA